MYLFGKRTDQLESEDISRLVDNQVKESKTLDYKRDFKLEEKDRKEFLYDIASMFNTDGGCIIYGIEELKDEKKQNTGTPKAIYGITIENEDKMFQKIEDIVKSNTEPSICSLELKKIIIGELVVLVIGIPKNLGLPCMVTLDNTNRFYKRKNTGKYAVDVYELNQMFMQNMVLKNSVEKFRYDRTDKVISGKIIPNIDIETSFFAHIFPFSFINDQIIDLSTIKTIKDILITMKPLYASGWDSMYNLDGFATFCTKYIEDKNSLRQNKFEDRTISYNQLLRNGIYEIYSSRLIEPIDGRLFLYEYNLLEIIDQIKSGLTVLENMRIEPPFYVSLSLHGILNGNIIYNGNSVSSRRFTTDEIYLPAVLIPNYESDIKESLKPIFDILWQAIGFNKSTIV